MKQIAVVLARASLPAPSIWSYTGVPDVFDYGDVSAR